ncbi:MAG: substrate-binding domain-containing protein [Anaerolineae bacterium]|nr:substrate-binding domain-containing protein [Anaerolineae bacterium]
MDKRWILGITTLAFTLVSCSLFSVSPPTRAPATVPVVTRSPVPSATPMPTATPTPSPTPDVESLRAAIAQDYPRVDGSTSALPLQRVIACRILGIPCSWMKDIFGDSWTISPDLLRADASDLEQMDAIVHNGTHGSYVNLIDGQADFILVARLPSDDELEAARKSGVTLDVRPVALDAFVFLVNAENPVDDLELETVRDIYAGRITRWMEGDLDGELITTYQRNPNSGSQELMEQLVMKGTPMVDSPDMILESMSGPINAVGEDRLGIGYSVYYYTAFILPDRRVKRIAIDGVAPTSANIADRTYPLTTEVYAVVREDTPQDSTARVLRDWLLTDEGQAVVAESGYVPLRGLRPDETFAIYLVGRETSAAQLAKIALQDLELEETPILSADDVVAYVWESHEVELTPSAYERLFEFSDSVSTSGRPFVVCVGSQRVYAGAFWMPFSSQSFDGIAIVLIPSDGRTICIQLGYPGSPDLFMWFDPRSDPRILRSLEEAGKLK